MHRPISLAALILAISASSSLAQVKPQGKPAATLSAADAAVIDRERALFDAVTKVDVAGFNRLVGTDFTGVDINGAMTWELSKSAEIIKACTNGQWTLSDGKVARVGGDITIVTYTASGEQMCSGKKSPSPIHGLSVWQKRGERWVMIAHTETPAAPVAK